jgi:23S rRNA (cytosine1962-C5)-methyltransferase
MQREAKPRLRLRVSAAAERQLRAGHPWVYGDSVRAQNRLGAAGELGIIYDRNDRFLAAGLFDPASPIRLRVLQTGKPRQIDGEWWQGRLEQAMARRAGLFDEETTGYRWIHGESDGWPGLVLDRYDSTLVLKLYSGAWFPWLPEIVPLLRNRLKAERMVLRLSRNAAPPAGEAGGVTDGSMLWGGLPTGPVEFAETGLRFEADVLRGQKTGFFLDQRENRRRVEAIARGRRVLNAFSFSGGFSLYAARGGAASVVDLDISAHALEAAKRNFARNLSLREVADCRHETAQADALEWLAGGRRERFDLIVIDPPSFAKRESERVGAIRAYGRLAALALGHLARAGILVACSCSAHVSAEEFFGAIRRAAGAAGRRFEELGTMGHPPDHAAGFAEAEYLKAIYLRFE